MGDGSLVPKICTTNPQIQLVQMKLKTTEFVPGTGPRSGPKLEVQIALSSCKKWQKAHLFLVI